MRVCVYACVHAYVCTCTYLQHTSNCYSRIDESTNMQHMFYLQYIAMHASNSIYYCSSTNITMLSLNHFILDYRKHLHARNDYDVLPRIVCAYLQGRVARTM